LPLAAWRRQASPWSSQPGTGGPPRGARSLTSADGRPPALRAGDLSRRRASGLPRSAATSGAASRRCCWKPLSDAAGAPLSPPPELEEDEAAGAASRRRCCNPVSAAAGAPLSPPLEQRRNAPKLLEWRGWRGAAVLGDCFKLAILPSKTST
jgi:hypothetical protein